MQVSGFQGLGILVFLYTLYSLSSGSVYAKAGAGGRSISRSDEPKEYWGVIIIYFGLSAALFFVF